MVRIGYKHSEETLIKIRVARAKQVITEETKNKIRLAMLGKKLSQETIAKMVSSRLSSTYGYECKSGTRLKISQANTGRVRSAEAKEKYSEAKRGEKHWAWIADRSKLIKRQERNDSAYYSWRKSVRDRDGWKCKIANGDCLGKVVAHHILSWAKFPELRYETNNGITLCRFHHPLKREDEIKLSPYFQSLVMGNSK